MSQKNCGRTRKQSDLAQHNETEEMDTPSKSKNKNIKKSHVLEVWGCSASFGTCPGRGRGGGGGGPRAPSGPRTSPATGKTKTTKTQNATIVTSRIDATIGQQHSIPTRRRSTRAREKTTENWKLEGAERARLESSASERASGGARFGVSVFRWLDVEREKRRIECDTKSGKSLVCARKTFALFIFCLFSLIAQLRITSRRRRRLVVRRWLSCVVLCAVLRDERRDERERESERATRWWRAHRPANCQRLSSTARRGGGERRKGEGGRSAREGSAFESRALFSHWCVGCTCEKCIRTCIVHACRLLPAVRLNNGYIFKLFQKNGMRPKSIRVALQETIRSSLLVQVNRRVA